MSRTKIHVPKKDIISTKKFGLEGKNDVGKSVCSVGKSKTCCWNTLFYVSKNDFEIPANQKILGNE